MPYIILNTLYTYTYSPYDVTLGIGTGVLHPFQMGKLRHSEVGTSYSGESCMDFRMVLTVEILLNLAGFGTFSTFGVPNFFLLSRHVKKATIMVAIGTCN